MLTLKDMQAGTTAEIVRVNGNGALRRRMLDMGLTSGTQVLVRKFAPLGDPIEIKVRGFELSIRKKDAEMIEVR